jgi:hypothetical protein
MLMTMSYDDMVLDGIDGFQKRAVKKTEPTEHPAIAAYWKVITGFNDLYFDFDKRTPAELRKTMEETYEQLKIVGGAMNISSLSVPQLKLCCGRGKKDAPPEPKQLGYGAGDLMKRLFSFLGFKQCPECKRRQGLFNRWRFRA